MNSENEMKTIKLVEDVINNNLNNFNNSNQMDDYEQNYKTEYKITPKMNESVQKLDPMMIIGISVLVGLFIYVGYKYSSDSDDKIEM
jgi:hypothetical protein